MASSFGSSVWRAPSAESSDCPRTTAETRAGLEQAPGRLDPSDRGPLVGGQPGDARLEPVELGLEVDDPVP